MNFISTIIALSTAFSVTAQNLKPMPVMTFFLPLPEENMLSDLFFQINADKARPPIETLLSVTISTDKTVVWVDHWEDEYDQDVFVASSKTTEIWGDGNASNGCAPTVKPCTNNADILMAGTSIVVQNAVDLPRVKTSIVYDGGDRIQSSFPVAITRACYAREPGSVLAGAVEVYDTTQWGMTFEAPVGEDTNLAGSEAFQLAGFMYMAMESNTKVTHADGSTKTLQMGQSAYVTVKQASRLVSNKPIQVILLTGDRWSAYETRWYTISPLEKWRSSYMSPVGDSHGKTKVIIYNPNDVELKYTLFYLKDGVETFSSRTLAKKQCAFSMVIPTGSGVRIDSNGNRPFVALSMTDTEASDGKGEMTWAEMHDWGYPLIPTSELTSQVLVGLGYACTNNDCQGQADRSVVWLSPVEDADIYVDFKNTGVDQKKYTAKKLQSIKIVDSDQDMSGATIFAVKMGSGKDGAPVDIAMAWGQDPSVSRPAQNISLDIGTAVPPFSLVKVAKLVDKAVVNTGEDLTYTIRVSNVGHKNVVANTLTVRDALDVDTTYIVGSVKISEAAGSAVMKSMSDTSSGTPFPLDDSGFVIPIDLPRRGGTVDIVFKVKVALSINKAKVINKGTLSQVGGGILPFEAESKIFFHSDIKIDNTVYLGVDKGAKCGTLAAGEYAEGLFGAAVTYCYKVTNTGKTHLSSMNVSSVELNYTKSLDGVLAPGASQTIHVDQTIFAALTSNATVIGQPVFPNEAIIPDLEKVSSTDPATVGMLLLKPSVNITNVVYVGDDNGASCNSGQEKVADIIGSKVVYCFTITNTGDSHLNNLILKNKHLDNFERLIPETLAPGQKLNISLPGTIAMDLDNMAEVTGMPVLQDGKPIPGLGEVRSSDPSGVTKLTFKPNIKVENTVYIGRDGGKQCGTPAAVEYVSGIFGLDVTYCFKVINNGETHLSSVQLVNELLNFSDTNIGKLAPGVSVMRTLDGKIDFDLKNFANVTGNPIMVDGRDIPDLADVKASDPSEVNRENSSPQIAIENTVLIGHDGSSCGTSAAKEYVEDFTGTNVTYCFTVKNTGSTYLDSIKINNPTLGVTEATVPRLAPGVAATIPIFRTITGKFENEANVRANPTTDDGTDVPNAQDVLATDKSSIGEIVFQPAVKIANTVYLGDNEHRSCGTAVEKVEGLFATAVTYCFTVTNTGNTHLDNIRIGNDILAFQDLTTIKTLAPGASAIVSVPRTITNTIDNSAKVTARPINLDKTPLPMGDVSHTDPSSVVRIAHKPQVAINNTVYIGTPGSCHLGVDTVRDIFSTDVTYCFRVTNMGDTNLNNISIVNNELKVNQVVSRVLAPGDYELISVPGQIRGDLLNTVIVSANPVLSDGSDIVGIPDVSHNDWSAVEKFNFTANIKVNNTVYLGHDDGKSCGTSGESALGLYGSNVTFCFQVTNNGQTHLRSFTLTNGNLSYIEKLINKTLAPFESMLITFPSSIVTTSSNLLEVVAVPTTSNGKVIVDVGDVKASDPSGVELAKHSPLVSIYNTVYLGNDGGKSCGTSVESVKDQYGAAVTYCFKVVNAGNSFLETVSVVNDDLSFKNSSIGKLAPGAFVTVSTPGKISSSSPNVATVSANPTLFDGSDIPDQPDVKASDPSSVELVAHKSGINVENTVYVGNDGGAKCSGNTSELVTGYPNTQVVYCFAVKNVGESHLKNVVISNTDLNFTDTSIKALPPGETKIISSLGYITKDLVNSAAVTGTPALSDGSTIPNAGPVNDADTSAVDQLDYAPKVMIENTVIISGNGMCPGRDLVNGMYGTPVIYCFNVSNVGDTPLTDVVIVNEKLAYKNQSRPLSPGEWVLVPVDGSITSDLKNSAVVTAQPLIPGMSPVTSEDASAVDKLDFVGGVKIVNQVYEGPNDSGAKCGTSAAVETVEGVYAAVVTYCFTVTNTGDTHMEGLIITNEKLGYKKDGIAPLPPGQSITVSTTGKILSDLVNVAVVTGNPVTETGKDIPDLTNVSSSDTSEVKKIGQASSVSIVNTVYPGKDGGKKCGTSAASELVSDLYGANVTYCFLVTNSGQSYLKNVTVENPILGFADKSIPLLGPGEEKMLTVDGTITGTIKNVAVVTGTSSLSDGTSIPGVEKVTSSDPSGVERLAGAPSVEIDNLVLLGSDPDKCDSLAVNYVEHYNGALVTYCFKVTNKGNTYLGDVKITNTALNYAETPIKILAPGASTTVVFPSKIDGALKNVAVVSGNPVLSDGKDIPDMWDVKWSDGSAVGQLVYYPSVKVDNKVYIGDDLGVSCSTKGGELASGKNGSMVVYCFEVTNTGDTFLNNVKLDNPELVFTDSSIGVLAPNETVLVAFSSSITSNLTNNVVATGNPSLQDGADISGAQDVTSTDSSRVALNLTDVDEKEADKPPYSPPKNGTQVCINDNWKKAYKDGNLVCSSKEVSLTSIKSTNTMKCKPGERIVVTVEATMKIDGSRNDVGWYVASDGGDALTGTCIVNGFQSGYDYRLFDSSNQQAGKVVWFTTAGADNDMCGDVKTNSTSVNLNTPLLVNADLPCADENEDGVLDVALCFTWRSDINNDGTCDLTTNIPGSFSNSCFCTRYDIKDVQVETPPAKPC